MSSVISYITCESEELAEKFREEYIAIGYLCEDCRNEKSEIFHEEYFKDDVISCPICGKYYRTKEECPFEHYYNYVYPFGEFYAD